MGELVEEGIEIAAPPEAVYDLISDVARMGEWSPEATGARRASAQVSAGDVFIGSNRRGPVRWWTVCTVRVAERPSVLEFDVDVGPIALSRWTYRLTPTEDGTRVQETWLDRRDGLRGMPIRLLGSVLIPGDRAAHNRRNIRSSLAALKQTAEGAN